MVALVIVTGIYLVRFCLLRQVATLHLGLPEKFDYRPRTCSPRPLFNVESPLLITSSSLTALDWPTTSFSPITSFRPPGVDYAGPSVLLEDDSVGSCFSFSGSEGGVVLISDSEGHHITHFTLDNSILDPEAGGFYYPKEGALWGLFEGSLPSGLRNETTSFVTDGATYILIGNFCLDPHLGTVWTFAIEEAIAAVPALRFSVFYLEISSNWGGTHTCVCRLRLYGSK